MFVHRDDSDEHHTHTRTRPHGEHQELRLLCVVREIKQLWRWLAGLCFHGYRGGATGEGEPFTKVKHACIHEYIQIYIAMHYVYIEIDLYIRYIE